MLTWCSVVGSEGTCITSFSLEKKKQKKTEIELGRTWLTGFSFFLFLNLPQQRYFCSSLVSKMSSGLFPLWEKWVWCVFIYEECLYCCLFLSMVENKQRELASLHVVLSLFLPAKPLLSLPCRDATNSPPAVSGTSLASPLRAPGAVLLLCSQINLLL